MPNERAINVSQATQIATSIKGQLTELNGRLGEQEEIVDRLNEGGLDIKDEVIEAQITAWLNDHPEATTTVPDGSLTYKKLVTGTLGYVTPEMFGAVGDGVTDDTDALQSALNALTSDTVLVFGSKTYLVTPNGTTNYILTSPNVNKIEIMGSAKTKIKVADNGGNYCGIIGFNQTETIYVHDICFDHNCENNVLATKDDYEKRGGRYTLTSYALTVCKNVKIENVIVYNCDSTVSFYFPSLLINSVRIISDNVYVSGCKWIDAQNVNIQAFSNYDQSYINAVANHILLTNNVFVGKQWSNSPRTAIEIHPHDTAIVANNIIDKFTSGMHVCGGILDQVTKSAFVCNNVFNVSSDGLNLWNYSRTIGNTLSIGMENVHIVNNTFNMQPGEYAYSTAVAFPAIRFYNHAKREAIDGVQTLTEQTLAYKNVVIEGNIIKYPRDVDTELADVKTTTSWAAIVCRYNNDVKDKHIYNLTIKNNNIYDCPFLGMLFENAVLNGTIISGNRLINCASHHFVNPTSGADGRIPYIDYMMCLYGTIETDVNIINNVFEDYVVDSKVTSYIFVHDLTQSPNKYFTFHDNVFDITATKTSTTNYIGTPNNAELVRVSGGFPSASAPRLPVQSSLYGTKVRVGNVEYIKLTSGSTTYWNRVEYASEMPSSNSGWRSGDIVYNIAPSAGGYIGWVLVGTIWKGFGAIVS